MPHPRIPCPYCSAPLRIRNRALIGKQLACPECGKPILIASAGSRELSLQKVQSELHSGTARKTPAGKHKKSGRFSRWLSVFRSPVGISWLVAGLLAFMLLLAAWPFGNPASQDRDRLQNRQEKHAADNDTIHAVGESSQTKIAKLPDATVDAVDLKNVFRPPVAAKKPVPLVEEDQEQKPVSIPVRPPVVATIPPEPIDVKAALAQPILRFQQQKPTPLRELLILVEEMAGVPIRYSTSERGDGSILLDEPVSLQLEQTTVGEILKMLLKQVHLDYELGYNEIRIVSTQPEATEENP